MFSVPVAVSRVVLYVILAILGLNHSYSYACSHLLNGPPLLTPLLEENKISEAQSLSRIRPDIVTSTCFSGYFTVNQECESNLFFWFCQAETNWEKSAVLLWLQGGPGSSSLFGLLKEIGPFYFKNGSAMKNSFSWNKHNNLLFIDQPVGTGFSFTDGGCYAKNKTDIAKDMYSAIIQFYKLFPNLKENRFYMAGESYAGHYIPYIAHYIHKMNPTAKHQVKLRGMMIGNGLMDAYYQSDRGEQLYDLGLIDSGTKESLDQLLSYLRFHLEFKVWEKASNAFNSIWLTALDFSAYVSSFNYNKKPGYVRYNDFPEIPILRNSIHVGSRKFEEHNQFVYENLVNANVYDQIQSSREEIEELLEHYPMVFYFGQLDLVCPYSIALPFFRNLSWGGASGYREVPRSLWCVDGQLAGFYKSYHNLHVVLVRNAGHSVPIDQPRWAYLLADSVTSNAEDPLGNLTTC